MDLAQLAKAFIVNTHTGERIPVMYNPEEYRLEQGNNFAEVGIPGLNAPPMQYVRGKARTLSMDLFFDTFEKQPPEDVRRHSGRVVALLDKLPQTGAPPILLFTMGPFTFECVLVDISQRFTMFHRDGTPVRATLTTRFQEFIRVQVEVEHGLFIGPPTLHNIASSQTVSDIAFAYLGDPRRWREVAEANSVDDPFHLQEGQAIVIPGRPAQ